MQQKKMLFRMGKWLIKKLKFQKRSVHDTIWHSCCFSAWPTHTLWGPTCRLPSWAWYERWIYIGLLRVDLIWESVIGIAHCRSITRLLTSVLKCWTTSALRPTTVPRVYVNTWQASCLRWITKTFHPPGPSWRQLHLELQPAGLHSRFVLLWLCRNAG